ALPVLRRPRRQVFRRHRRNQGAEPASQSTTYVHWLSLDVSRETAPSEPAAPLADEPTAEPPSDPADSPVSGPGASEPCSANSRAASKYVIAPDDVGSWVITVWPKLGASEIRTDRGIAVRSTASLKFDRTSSATPAASR